MLPLVVARAQCMLQNQLFKGWMEEEEKNKVKYYFDLQKHDHHSLVQNAYDLKHRGTKNGNISTTRIH